MQTLKTRVPEELKNGVVELAKSRKISEGEIVRKAVKNYLQEQKITLNFIKKELP